MSDSRILEESVQKLFFSEIKLPYLRQKQKEG